MDRQRYMFKMRNSGAFFVFHAKTYGVRYPAAFYVNADTLRDFVVSCERSLLFRDGYDYAEFSRRGDLIHVTLTHIGVYSDSSITGRRDEFAIDASGFCAFVRGSGYGDWMRCLSRNEFTPPKIVVKQNDNLHAIVQHPLYRRKFARFMGCAFQWYGATEIELYNDFVPYSFFFREKCGDKEGMCGGVILHGQDDPRQAKYSIHT